MVNNIKLLTLIALLFYANLSFSQSDDDLAVDFISMARAAKVGDLASLTQLLKRGIKANGYQFEPASSHLTHISMLVSRPLQQAAENGHTEIVQQLLKYGADPNWCCCDCVTALHMAINSGHEEIANVLINAGANTQLPYSNQGKRFNNCLLMAKDKGLLSTVQLISEKQNISH